MFLTRSFHALYESRDLVRLRKLATAGDPDARRELARAERHRRDHARRYDWEAISRRWTTPTRRGTWREQGSDVDYEVEVLPPPFEGTFESLRISFWVDQPDDAETLSLGASLVRGENEDLWVVSTHLAFPAKIYPHLNYHSYIEWVLDGSVDWVLPKGVWGLLGDFHRFREGKKLTDRELFSMFDPYFPLSGVHS